MKLKVPIPMGLVLVFYSGMVYRQDCKGSRHAHQLLVQPTFDAPHSGIVMLIECFLWKHWFTQKTLKEPIRLLTMCGRNRLVNRCGAFCDCFKNCTLFRLQRRQLIQYLFSFFIQHLVDPALFFQRYNTLDTTDKVEVDRLT